MIARGAEVVRYARGDFNYKVSAGQIKLAPSPAAPGMWLTWSNASTWSVGMIISWFNDQVHVLWGPVFRLEDE